MNNDHSGQPDSQTVHADNTVNRIEGDDDDRSTEA